MIRIFNKNDDLTAIFSRSQLDDDKTLKAVEDIVRGVRVGGDKALFDYCKKLDKCEVNSQNIAINQEELARCYEALDSDLKTALEGAIKNVREYHQKQKDILKDVIYDKKSSKLGWLYRPMNRVGIYVPGGKANYPSSVIMCALPAIVAGVKEVVVATPNPNPITMAVAYMCGVSKVYRLGGAHGIAALAYGSESVDKVDLIAGPGNVWVTLAKKLVYGHVAIDMIAGPSEILVIADDTAVAEYVASDLLSQAEHDEMAASILVTTSQSLAIAVKQEIEKQTKLLVRQEIIKKSLASNGAIIVVDSLDEAIKIANQIAPEHLEICTKDAHNVVRKITNAGAIFLGNYSPEPLGDYYAGASHCLPTSGSARYFNVLSVDTFIKKISYINYSKADLLADANNIIAIGDCEGLTAHANTIRIRQKKEGV